MKKKGTKLVFLLINLLFIAQTVSAQDSTIIRESYLGLEFGLTLNKVKDELVMPVKYSGTNFTFGLNYERRRNLSVQEVVLHGTAGSIRTPDANIDNFGARYIEPRSAFYLGEVYYSYRHLIPSSSRKYRFYGGASAEFFMNVRLNERWDNSLVNYDAAFTPLSISGRVERDISTKNKTLQLFFDLRLPVIVYVVRPEYSGVPDFLNHEQDFVSSLFQTPASSWTGIWNFPRIRTRLGMQLPIRGSNYIRFSYSWEYYSFQDPRKVQAANHGFTFMLITRI